MTHGQHRTSGRVRLRRISLEADRCPYRYPMPQYAVNPSESQSSLSDHRPIASEETVVRMRWLVFASLLLTLLIEVLPTEADLKWVAARHSDVRQFLVVKAVCLAVILVPLALYVWINGWRGIKAVKARVAVIGIIVVLNLAFDTWLLVDWLLRK